MPSVIILAASSTVTSPLTMDRVAHLWWVDTTNIYRPKMYLEILPRHPENSIIGLFTRKQEKLVSSSKKLYKHNPSLLFLMNKRTRMWKTQGNRIRYVGSLIPPEAIVRGDYEQCLLFGILDSLFLTSKELFNNGKTFHIQDIYPKNRELIKINDSLQKKITNFQYKWESHGCTKTKSSSFPSKAPVFHSPNYPYKSKWSKIPHHVSPLPSSNSPAE